MGQIWLTGDTHGDWMRRLNMNSFPEQKEMTKDDYVIVTGDFGICDNSKRENYNLDWLEERNFSTLFVAGNHSNYDILDSLPVDEWHGGKINLIRPSVIHLRRGEVFNILSRKFFCFGSAKSHDISDGILDINDPELNKKIQKMKDEGKYMYRIKGLTWWEQELPSEEEMENGRRNLEKHNWKVDYIISHDCAASTLALLSHGAYKPNIVNKYLEEIHEKCDYKLHLFGHHHVSKKITEKDICLYEQIVRIL